MLGDGAETVLTIGHGDDTVASVFEDPSSSMRRTAASSSMTATRGRVEPRWAVSCNGLPPMRHDDLTRISGEYSER